MKQAKILLMLLLVSTCIVAQSGYVQISASDTRQDIIRKAAQLTPSPRQLRWQQLELTAFFHFGINTYTGKEWGTGKENPAIFNPTHLNAEQWVTTMKAAGFKQVIITAKHHDGFCLWATQTTEHSVKNAPWKNGKGDVVKEVAEACKKHNIGFGVYLSPWDMNAPMYGTDEYNDFFAKQLTELLSNYGRVDEVWFDGANGEGANGKKQEYSFERWYALIRSLQPHAVIAIMGPDVRWVGTESGKGRETEWSVLPVNNLNITAIAKNSQQTVLFKPKADMLGEDLGNRNIIMQSEALVWYPAETDVSIRPGWFYRSTEDNNVKTPKELNEIYFTSVGMNSVLLLNVPPDKRGLINEKDVESLSKWYKMRNKTFRKNLLKNANFKSENATNLNSLTDNNMNTYTTTKNTDSSTLIVATLPTVSTFDVLALQENIKIGQRVEKFSAYYKKNEKWIKFTQGTTIGYKRLLRFKPVTASVIKIEIESSRLNPNLSEIGLYRQAE